MNTNNQTDTKLIEFLERYSSTGFTITIARNLDSNLVELYAMGKILASGQTVRSAIDSAMLNQGDV